ncbi:hypothetical protein D3C72_1117680 [compost metagenome]
MVAKIKPALIPDQAPATKMQGGPAGGDRRTSAIPDPNGGFDPPSHVEPGRRSAIPATPSAAGRAPLPVDQTPVFQVVKGGAPVRRTKAMRHHTPLADHQRDRTVGGAMPRGRNIGPGAVLIEVPAQDGDDHAKAHQISPRLRKLAVPSRPTIR